MSNRIYNVKQAAKILGLSTNTTYKFLREGRIKSARGNTKGVFIITEKGLEEFLGTKIPDVIIPPSADPKYTNAPDVAGDDVTIEVAPPALAVKVVRILILISLLFIFAELITNQNLSLFTLATRLVIIFVFILISYQFGGFIKK